MSKIKAIIKFCFRVILLFSFPDFSIAHNQPIEELGNIIFIPNIGQWTDPFLFKGMSANADMFFEQNAVTYVLGAPDNRSKLHHHKQDADTDPFSGVLKYHSYKVIWIGANKEISITPGEALPYYHNYFYGKDTSKWKGNVPVYSTIIYHNVYHKIDMQWRAANGNLKYEFVVKPGAHPSAIKLKYEGLEDIHIDKLGRLYLSTSIGSIIETEPYVYQNINGGKKRIACTYHLENKEVTFIVTESYDRSKDLIIDPEIIFSSFSGSFADNFGYTATYDTAGNLYGGGIAFAQGYPITIGAFEDTFQGRVDIAISKFSPLGDNLIYSTYLGGSNGDQPSSMIVDPSGNLIVVGRTESNDYPTTPGSYSPNFNGYSDIILTKFNLSGTGIIASTYLGGSVGDGSNVSMAYNYGDYYRGEVITDKLGNIYMASNTASVDFPITSNAAKKSVGGSLDGVLVKLSPALDTLIYSTYIGGTNDDAAYVLVLDSEQQHIYVSGGTRSSNFHSAVSSGTWQSTFQGGLADGFICKFVNGGEYTLQKATYIGTNAYDQCYGIQVDVDNNVYTMGQTLGDFPVTAGVYSNPGSSQFVMKLDSTLSKVQYSTVFGNGSPAFGKPNISPIAFLVDVCKNVFVSGWGGRRLLGGNMAGMPVTPNAIQSTTDSNDFYFIVLNDNATELLYGTYFGGTDEEHVDGGTSRFNPDGIIYQAICAGCNGGTYPTTPGVWSTTNNSTRCNMGVVKINFPFKHAKASIAYQGNDSIGCAPHTIEFINNSSNANTYIWDFGDGSAISTITNPTHTFTNVGTYMVRLIALDESGCIISDTSYSTVTILEVNLPMIKVTDTVLCSYNDTIDLTVTIANPSQYNTIAWGPNAGILSRNDQSTITVDPNVNSVFYVTVKDTIPGVCGLSVSDTVHIGLFDKHLDIFNNDSSVCAGATVQIEGEGSPGFTYLWTPPIGISDTTILNPVITLEQSQTYILTASFPGCTDTTIEITFNVHEYPIVHLGPDKEVCQQTPVALESLITPYRTDYHYQWLPIVGLHQPNAANTSFLADSSIQYSLVVTTPIGCSGSDSIHITVHPGGFGYVLPDTGYCPEIGFVALWAAGGSRYAWTPAYGLNDTSIYNPIASPATPTDYTVYIYSEHNCVDTEQVRVSVYPNAILEMPDSVNIYPGESYHLQPGTNCLYFSWFPLSGINNVNISDPVFDPEVRTRYWVTARTENGCEIKDSIDILPKETIIDMPNAFHPGTYGNNQVFKPSKRGIARLNSFTIYNRWGNKVFATTNIDEGWDGTFNNKPQPAGVYVYTIDAVTDQGKLFVQHGNVTLIR